jgi:manganese transport protein
VAAAMLLAGAVNLAMLLAATSLPGSDTGGTLQGAHDAISITIGETIATLLAVALLASGVASTAVGCYAGAVVMDGLLQRRVPLLLRRVGTLIPALIVLAIGVNPTTALVLSQVVLSFGIPFALIPLVILTARPSVMGAAVNHRTTTLIALLVVTAVLILNAVLLYLTITPAL